MKKTFCALVLTIIFASAAHAQTLPAEYALNEYQGTPTKVNDLVNTKLDLSFDYEKSYAYGKAFITLRPHFYPTDTLTLDARRMDIKQVLMIKSGADIPLKFDYDKAQLKIKLDKFYTRDQQYTVRIDYTAKPNEQENKFLKGMYFINPQATMKGIPTQIYTHSTFDMASTWFPTIDHPNQKCTGEIILTVPSKYVTLSNGKLIGQKNNQNGTRTDDWKMDLPNAPYLFFFAVGDYAIVKDNYKNLEVNYYVEKSDEKLARRTFGKTPEMIGFIERTLGVKYPWAKYDQITGRDLPFSMENTSCTLHGDYARIDARQLSEEVNFGAGICHELFHQWFGDLVTAESWSNLALNEAFADLIETIWTTYKDGKDAGDAVNYREMNNYLADSAAATRDLVRFYYSNRFDMQDYSVTYVKGGRILNMLRKHVGDSAFFHSLKLYLNQKKFKSAEAQELRLAFEEITGMDLNWYWNQWFYGHGHPKLNISYLYNDDAGKATVIIQQTQSAAKPFKVPLSIDVYEQNTKTRFPVWLGKEADTFIFNYKQRPLLINVDGDKILLCEKQDNKSIENFIFQFSHAGLFVDRMEAVAYCASHQDQTQAIALLKTAVTDPSPVIRQFVLQHIDLSKEPVNAFFRPVLVSLATTDPDFGVRSQAISTLAGLKETAFGNLFAKAAMDSSYEVAGTALEALDAIDSTGALHLAERLAKEPSKNKLAVTLFNKLAKYHNGAAAASMISIFTNLRIDQKMETVITFSKYLADIKPEGLFTEAVDHVIRFRDFFPAAFFGEFIQTVNHELKTIAKQKDAVGLRSQADYIRSMIPA